MESNCVWTIKAGPKLHGQVLQIDGFYLRLIAQPLGSDGRCMERLPVNRWNLAVFGLSTQV